MEEAEVRIGGDVDEAVSALRGLAETAKGSTGEIKQSLEGASTGFEELTKKVRELAAAFLSFEGMKRAVETTTELGIEAEKVAQRLGISQAAASQFAVAMDDIHASTDEVLGIMQRQNRQLKTNEDGINALGVATRDGNGALLSQQEILMNSVEVLNGYEAGTNRNQAALVLFGGRVGDMTALLKLNNKVMEEAKIKADELGLTMSVQDVEAVSEFRKAMNDVQDVLKAIGKAIGSALMPLLSDMGRWFADIGPGAVMAMSLAFRSLVTVLDMVWTAFNLVWEVVRFLIRELATFTAGVATSIGKWKEGPRAMAQAWHEAMAQMTQEHTDFLARMDRVGDGFASRMKNRWSTSPAADKTGGGAGFTDPKKNDKAAEERKKLFEQQEADMLRSLQISEENQAKERDANETIVRKQILDAEAEKKRLFMKAQEDMEKSLKIASDNQQKEMEISAEAAYKGQKKAAEATQKAWEHIFSPIKSAFDTSITGIIMGTQTLQHAMQNIFQSILLSFVKMGIGMVESWAIAELTKTQATALGVDQRAALEEVAAIKSVALSSATAIKNIMTSAWEAMARAFTAMVGTPFVGPAIAPAAGAAAFGTVAALAGSVMSAAGGYDIPAGVNPVTQLHEREMVLPAGLSNAVRNMAAGGGSGGGMNVTIHAVDAASVKKLFMDHGPALAESMRRQARNLAPSSPR